MHLDVINIHNFYAKPLGQITQQILCNTILSMWPNVKKSRIMGIGYALPVLKPFYDDAKMLLIAMPSQMGAMSFAAQSASITVLAQETNLPIPDSSIDRVVVLHCLETTSSPQKAIREIWRVLIPGGRLIVIVPNSFGIWAYSRATPFSAGNAYTHTQLDCFLKQAMFSTTQRQGALHVPPSEQPTLFNHKLEQIGKKLWPVFCGVIFTEAIKKVHDTIYHVTNNHAFSATKQSDSHR